MFGNGWQPNKRRDVAGEPDTRAQLPLPIYSWQRAPPRPSSRPRRVLPRPGHGRFAEQGDEPRPKPGPGQQGYKVVAGAADHASGTCRWLLADANVAQLKRGLIPEQARCRALDPGHLPAV